MKNNYSVFLIDNNETDIFINQRVLRNFSESINLFDFSSGTEALEYLKKNRIIPRYILLGLNVPVGNGFDFLGQYEKLNFNKKDTSIYVLSTFLLPSDLEKLKKDHKYLNYIEKPLTVEKLHGKINSSYLEEETQTRT